MEQATDVVGNPTVLLIERIFWLGLGVFLGIAIISSIIRGLNENKTKKHLYKWFKSLCEKSDSTKQLNINV